MAIRCPKGKWSGGIQLVNFDRSEGFSDITDIGGMFAFGATDRIEMFGAFGDRRIDADLVPVARNGQPQDYLINKGWSTGIGDAYVGAKFNITSQATSNGVSTALRVMAKVPTASADDGLGTGKPDFQFDLIGSREFAQKVDLSAAAGIKLRGQPDGYNLTPGFVWGIGGAFPSRSRFRVIGEMKGEALFDQSQTFTGSLARSRHALGMGSGCDARSVWRLPVQRQQRRLLRRRRHLHRVVLPASPRLSRPRKTATSIASACRCGFGYHPSGVKNFAPPPTTVTPTRAADPGDAAQPRPDGQGALRAVHG